MPYSWTTTATCHRSPPNQAHMVCYVKCLRSSAFAHLSLDDQTAPWGESQVDASMPFDFHNESASNFTPLNYSGPPAANEISVTEQPWSPERHQLYKLMPVGYDQMPNPHSLSSPLFIASTVPQPFTSAPALPSQLSYEPSVLHLSIPEENYIAHDAHQRQRSPSSSNSYVPQYTPPFLPVDSSAQSMHPFTHRNMETNHLSQSLVAQTGSSDSSPSPTAETVMPRTVSRGKQKSEQIIHQPSQEGTFSVLNLSQGPKIEHSRHSGITKKTISKGRGGREKGTYKLPPNKAQEVRERREQGACWTCALQRDVVSLKKCYLSNEQLR